MDYNSTRRLFRYHDTPPQLQIDRASLIKYDANSHVKSNPRTAYVSDLALLIVHPERMPRKHRRPAGCRSNLASTPAARMPPAVARAAAAVRSRQHRVLLFFVLLPFVVFPPSAMAFVLPARAATRPPHRLLRITTLHTHTAANNNIRLVASDVDGTLLDSRHRVSPRTVHSIRAMKEKGVLFVPATGTFVMYIGGV